MNRIPVLLCIDVEPLERTITPHIKSDWEGFEKLFEFFMRERPRFEAATKSPARFSWFLRMDPQIAHTYGSYEWVAMRYADLFKALEAAGDEIGLHPHAWRWDKRNRAWFQDFASQDWVDHCVRSGFEAYKRAFNRPCRSFRFGDHWMNDATLDVVESLGARFDLTIEPGRKGPSVPDTFTGSFPDFTHAPRHPYHPSRLDFRVSGSKRMRDLWAIPLSTETTSWADSTQGFTKPDQNCAPGGNPNPLYEGCIDTIDCNAITGWAWDVNRPDAPLEVEIFDGDRLLGKTFASIYRPDLKRVGKGNGKHCFRFNAADSLKDGRPHTIQARISESGFYLHTTSNEYACPEMGNCREEYLALNPGDFPGLFCLMADKLLNRVSISHLAIAMRTDVGSYEHLMLQLEDNIDYLLSHDLVEQFVFDTPQEMRKPFA